MSDQRAGGGHGSTGGDLAGVALRVDDLGVEMGRPGVALGESVPLVRHVSFEIAPGEMVGLAGESGSGKSLTALAVVSLLPDAVRRSTGTVELPGSAPPRAARSGRDGAAMIFQNPMTSLNPSLRIGDQIAESVRLRHRGTSRRTARRRAMELLDRVEVDRAADRMRQYPFEFSGGMLQRVMIATALASEPSVLVADEPTTSLDVTIQREVMNLIDQLRRDLGLAVLLISHDLGVVGQRCDRLLVMYAGELVETGPTAQVLSQPLHPYVEGLIGCIPERALATGRLAPLPGQVPPPDAVVSGCRFADRCAIAIPECREAPIPLDAAAGGRSVRCIRWHERAQGLAAPGAAGSGAGDAGAVPAYSSTLEGGR